MLYYASNFEKLKLHSQVDYLKDVNADSFKIANSLKKFEVK